MAALAVQQNNEKRAGVLYIKTLAFFPEKRFNFEYAYLLRE